MRCVPQIMANSAISNNNCDKRYSIVIINNISKDNNKRYPIVITSNISKDLVTLVMQVKSAMTNKK